MILSKNVLLRAFEIEDALEIAQLKSSYQENKTFLFKPYLSNIQDEKEWIMNMDRNPFLGNRARRPCLF